MIVLTGHGGAGGVDWDYSEGTLHEGMEGVVVVFELHSYCTRNQALRIVADALAAEEPTWLQPIALLAGDWVWDADAMRRSAVATDQLRSLEWFKGRITLTPDYDADENVGFSTYEAVVTIRFSASPETMWSAMSYTSVPELRPFVEKFRRDHPTLATCAFIMMRYEDTPLHKRILETIRGTCSRLGTEALLAGDRAYADDLLPNIRTYMHCCGLGIAVFERLTTDDFNPNVSLEVGYMMALGKPVCLLRDSTLPSLQTDLVGRLYQTFDPQTPENSIPPVLQKWMKNRQLG